MDRKWRKKPYTRQRVKNYYTIIDIVHTMPFKRFGYTFFNVYCIKSFNLNFRILKLFLKLFSSLQCLQEADLSLLPMAVTSMREQVLDFSILLGTSSYGFLVKRPTFTPKPNALLKPFSPEVIII